MVNTCYFAPAIAFIKSLANKTRQRKANKAGIKYKWFMTLLFKIHENMKNYF